MSTPALARRVGTGAGFAPVEGPGSLVVRVRDADSIACEWNSILGGGAMMFSDRETRWTALCGPVMTLP